MTLIVEWLPTTIPVANCHCNNRLKNPTIEIAHISLYESEVEKYILFYIFV